MNAIVSPNVRIRHPGHFKAGPYSIIDDYSYFSTQVEIGEGSHIAPGCTVAGGVDRLFKMGDYSSLSSGVKIYCASNDFVNGLVAIFPEGYESGEGGTITGDVSLANYTGVGANSVIMPNNQIPEGVAIGASSYVPANYPFESWTVYAGAPIREIKPRNRENVLRQVAELRLLRSSR